MKTKIRNYINLANELSVKQMYLNKNVNASEIKFEDLKSRSSGHWGTTPAINTIYANLGFYLNKNKNIKTKIIVGTGHSGLAVFTNLFLMGKLYDKYNIRYNKIGINRLIELFGEEIRTETNPQYPDTIYDGGELGYSLPFAYGYALNNDVFIPCIIGDGESETGTISSSWQLNILLEGKLKGKVLPIINLNGLKMGSKSFLSLLTRKEIKSLFESFKYKVFFANNSNFQTIINKSFKHNNSLIIFESEKGETIPNYNEEKLCGNLISHKDPLNNMNLEDKKIFIEKWLKQYERTDEIVNLKEFNYFSEEYKLNEIKLPKVSDYYETNSTNTNLSGLSKYLSKVCDLNKNFLITSPDEGVSNKIGILLNKKNTFEILNENICQCLMQGNIVSGNPGVIISYEAFMPISNTILSQYMKYLYMSKKESNIQYNSLNYILTSTCWENNYSHQNPEFVSNVLLKEWDFVNAYYPKDANNLLHCIDKSLRSKNQVNIITTSKGKLPQYDTINTDIEIIKNVDNPDLVLIASGDYILNEVLEATSILEEENIKVKLIYVTNLKELQLLNKSKLNNYFGTANVLYCYHGYSKTIYGLLKNSIKNLLVLGYQDKSDVTGSSRIKLQKNDLDYKSIVKNAKKMIRKGNAYE